MQLKIYRNFYLNLFAHTNAKFSYLDLAFEECVLAVIAYTSNEIKFSEQKVNKSKKSYDIIVKYPESEEAKIKLRKKLGEAYGIFVKEYILRLQTSDEKKKELYSRVIKQLIKYK